MSSGRIPDSSSSSSVGCIWPLARRAKQADQPLREHAVERRHKVVRLDAHVKKAADDVDNVVGVDGGENKVAGERRLDGDLSGLLVTNFTDHDLVRIVTQDRTQARGQT